MTIDRDELINLLVEKTGMSQKEIEQQLDELSSRIINAANRGKALEIKGFGLFYFDENGDLTFRASDMLDSEINFSHAGMEPVEIEPPKSGSAPTSKELPAEKDEKSTLPVKDEKAETPAKTDDPDDVFGIGKTLSGQAGKDDEENEDHSASFGKLFQEEPGDVKPEPKPKEKISKAGTASAGKKVAASSGKDKKPVKSRDPMNTIIVVVLAGIFLFAAYFLFTEFINPPQQPETTQQQDDIEVEDPPVTAERDITESAEPEDPEPLQVLEPENEPEPLDDPIDEVTTTDPYGLYGEIADTEGNVYTIVVHSLRDRSVADQTADDLMAEGFRVSVSERVVDGQTYFRVGIGQFPTINEAQQEATTLPDPLNNQNFIQRLQ